MRKFVLAVLLGALVVSLSGCGNQSKDFKKQLEQAGFAAVRVSEDKEKKTSTSKKRPKKTTTKVKYEGHSKIGNCDVEFEQGKGEKRYYLDEVDNNEPAVGLMKDNPTKADVEAYLRGPDSPCKI